MEKRLLVHCLYGARYIAVTLIERLIDSTRCPKQIRQRVRIYGAEHRFSAPPHMVDLLSVMPEVAEIKLERAIVVEPYDPAHLLSIFILAVRSESHDLVLVSVMRKP